MHSLKPTDSYTQVNNTASINPQPENKNYIKKIENIKCNHLMGMLMKTIAIATVALAAFAGSAIVIGSGLILPGIPFVIIGGLSLFIFYLCEGSELYQINNLEKSLKEIQT